jgi:hypothetical protein
VAYEESTFFISIIVSREKTNMMSFTLEWQGQEGEEEFVGGLNLIAEERAILGHISQLSKFGTISVMKRSQSLRVFFAIFIGVMLRLTA